MRRGRVGGMVRLLATDIDGTLLNSSHEITPRTRAAFAAAREAGLDVVPISGRQPYSIGVVVQGTALQGDVIGSNGAVSLDLHSREVHFEELMSLESQREIADRMRELFPGLKVVSVQSAGDRHIAEHGYSGMAELQAIDSLWEVQRWFATRDEVLAHPSLKLVLRDDNETPETLLAAARELAVEGVHPTASGAPFIEVGRAGISKGSALEHYCRLRGIERKDVVVFGDHINDVEMLRWAGLGVAMGNAVAEAKAAADHVTLSNDEDGLAVAVEEILGQL